MTHRILAHNIVYEGKPYGLSVAEYSDDSVSVRISPYVVETANTVFVPGTVTISVRSGKVVVCKSPRAVSGQ